MLLTGINQFRKIIIHKERRNRNVKISILFGVNRLNFFFVFKPWRPFVNFMGLASVSSTYVYNNMYKYVF